MRNERDIEKIPRGSLYLAHPLDGYIKAKRETKETEKKEKEKNYVRFQAKGFSRIFSIFRERSRIEFV